MKVITHSGLRGNQMKMLHHYIKPSQDEHVCFMGSKSVLHKILGNVAWNLPAKQYSQFSCSGPNWVCHLAGRFHFLGFCTKHFWNPQNKHVHPVKV